MNVLDFYSAKQYRVKITLRTGIIEERIDNDCYKELPEVVFDSEYDGNNDDEIAIYSKKNLINGVINYSQDVELQALYTILKFMLANHLTINSILP